jgi:hypothetical protein
MYVIGLETTLRGTLWRTPDGWANRLHHAERYTLRTARLERIFLKSMFPHEVFRIYRVKGIPHA